jgi:radical SAM-linked protein
MPAQRIRVAFAKGDRVRYISHLDVLRYWERCIRRAELPLSYSQGFTPHPKLAFAGPLPLGFLADSEIMDVTLDDRVDLADFEVRLRAQTTADLTVVRVEEVPLGLIAPQSSLAWADYAIDLPAVSEAGARDAVAAFLAAREWPWTETRHDKPRTYDLRAAVASLTVAPLPEGVRLTTRLRASQEMMARPEQLVEAILPGAEILLVTRLGLVFDDVSPAHEAWRRRGRFEE